MGASITNGEATYVLNTRFANGAYPVPTGHTVSLHTGDPGPSDTPANELSGAGYVRQAVSFTASAAQSGSPVASNLAVTFSNLPAATVTWFEVHQQAANPATRPSTRAAFASGIVIAAGQGLTIPAGSLTIGIS